jgi:hypothetical protein
VSLLTLGLFARAEENPHGDVFKNRPVPAIVDFNRDVRPVLSEKCYHCHGADEGSRKAKLRLDVRTEAVKDRDGTIAVKPKDPDNSEVMRRILSTDPDEVMPPPKEGHALSARETEIIKKWITQGAPYAEHWAFVKPVRPALPAVSNYDYSLSNAIDSFIAAKLSENGLRMSREADKRTLIRRVSLDLTGLPPTPAEVNAFLADSTSQAYERMVDACLQKPGFGERWARMWLDIARYADSAGYGSDPLRMNIWPYRDWVINAFNRNMPYDEFTRDQLAGDLLPQPTEDQLVATAFHRNTMTNTEGGTDDEEFRVAAVKDRIAVTMQAWMGLTLGCAQCHSHKFDPISQQEYYEFYAIFNQTADSDLGSEEPTLPVPNAMQKAQMAKLKEEIASLQKTLSRPAGDALEKEMAAWEPLVLRPVTWTPLMPSNAATIGLAQLDIQKDASVLVHGAAPGEDTYVVKIDQPMKGITALRLEALTDPSLPANGPGRTGAGNAVVSELKATLTTGKSNTAKGRFVRVELPGKGKMISLAEVQAFSNGKNVALKGTATQSTTDYDGEAKRAIDGNTNGSYFESNSVTHTALSDDPWWELDLGDERNLNEIVLWNRTDGGTASRLNGVKISVLDAARQPTFTRVLVKAPATSEKLTLSNSKSVRLVNPSADFAQDEFGPTGVLDGAPKTGWAFAPEFGKPHALVVELGEPIDIADDDELAVTIQQTFGDGHTLGRFRLSATAQGLPVRELPPSIRSILAKPKPQRSAAEQSDALAYYRPISKLLAGTQTQLEAKQKELANIKPIGVPVMREVTKDKLRETHLLVKGNFLSPGDKVKPALLKSYHATPPETPTRLTVAAWLMSRDNPLTARVAVNRYWAQLFGRGLVETEEDFGTQGTLPTHPELLDWLAVDFMDLKWDTKALLKKLVMSSTYRQISKPSRDALQKDARNLWLSHYPRLRLDAEQVRDQALALSGLLSPKLGGPSVYPPQPDGLWRAAFNGQRNWDTSKGEDRFRRGLYTFWRRTVPYPSMATFDAPSRENMTARRVPTNTPLQAFVTLNDPAYVEMAQALGARLVREGGSTVASRMRYALELCLARPATSEQVQALEELFTQELEGYKARPEDAAKLSTSPSIPAEKAFPKDLAPAAAAAWTAVANVLLNLDGVLTKG